MSWVGRAVHLPDGQLGLVVDERGGEVAIRVHGSVRWVPRTRIREVDGELWVAAEAPASVGAEPPPPGPEPDAVGAEPPPAAAPPAAAPGPPMSFTTGEPPYHLPAPGQAAPAGGDAPDRSVAPRLGRVRRRVRDLFRPPRSSRDVRGVTLDPGGGSPARTPAPAGGGHRPPGPEPQPPRSLSARLPLRVPTGAEFAVSVQVIQSARPAAMGGLATFTAAPGGTTVHLVADAPGLVEVEGRLRRDVTVFPTGDTEAVEFVFRGAQPGPHQIYVRALDGGTYLGEIALTTTLEHGGTTGPLVDRQSEVSDDERADGELALLVTYDTVQERYRFQLIDADLPAEVLSSALLEDPREAVERLVRQLDTFAAATSGYSAAQTRDYLMNAGVQLWSTLLPADLREQFWERRDRVSQLTIFADADVVPWELLFPLDHGRTPAGFLVEQFPVVRWRRGARPVARAGLSDVRFVLPPGSPAQAAGEVDAIAAALGVTDARRVTTLDELSGLVSAGGFDALHFACHNAFSPDDGSTIHLDAPFAPVQLQVAQTQGSLQSTHPLVFMNACRSAGQVPGWTALNGWAEAFLDAGAGAFIGSSWAVRDSSAREFAEHVYGALHDGRTLGEAVTEARVAIAGAPGDSSWLAYTVYGNPRLRVAPAP